MELDELEQLAIREKAERSAVAAISQARVRLVLARDAKDAFFARMCMDLGVHTRWDVPTAATDGDHLYINPDFVNALTPKQVIGLLAHEVMHCALSHHSRRMHRNPKAWNVACDLAINDRLKECGYELPKGGLFPGEDPFGDFEKGLSSEGYYAKLPRQMIEDMDGGDDPGGCGGVIDAGDDAKQRESEAKWKVTLAQAQTVAKQRGTLPGGLSRMVEEQIEEKADWRKELGEFVSRILTAKDDYSWTMPNKRFIQQGIYLPTLRSESLGHVVIAVDTSGSTFDPAVLAMFAGQMNAILECAPCSASIVYCDAEIQRVDDWVPSDGPLVIDFAGGGGTSHKPLWKWLRESGIDAACMVCLTDGYTDFGSAPDVPVLWAMTTNVVAPFGRTIRLED